MASPKTATPCTTGGPLTLVCKIRVASAPTESVATTVISMVPKVFGVKIKLLLSIVAAAMEVSELLLTR